MLGFMQTPDDWSSLFQQTYGIGFPDAIHEFEAGVREGTAP
jgi:hypothetical protein